ncbi:hypothetical protein [Cupriavidus sp. AcVe19-6a]|uniref:hypothetical protein n=1 Tax=Cupriavidus sp. AcVe19-6a TaxID=2821358 RepID=UPI001AEA64C9|nr:hypothetical protein [Cupriavidus sp. AcVe19-6a]MBP0634923.1 hypothetical protein [Cupriavidus sp. AcVe19-6a]
MTHAAQVEIDALLGGEVHKNLPNATQAAAIVASLALDAKDYLYNSMVSVLESANGMVSGRYTWSAVKGYYGAFYAMRAHLASHHVCICYVASKSSYYSLHLSGPAKVVKLKSSTHSSVLIAYEQHPSTKSVVQDIMGVAAPTWLKELRETANYRQSSFTDPLPLQNQPPRGTDIFRHIDGYLAAIDTYCYDPAHAAVAYPLKLIGMALNSGVNFSPTADQSAHLATLLTGATDRTRKFFGLA